jgi:hypothetical protein
MWQKLQVIRAGARMWKKMMLALVIFGVGVLAFCWGRHGALSMAKADPPTDRTIQDQVVRASHTDYGQRPVAFIYNNMPITREDLGEYLIARFGAQRIDFLINHRIIDMACKASNIVITDQVMMVEFEQNLKDMKMPSAQHFEQLLLKKYGKTIYEWKEDVIRPKLALRELARPRVRVTEKDLRDAFESHYDTKVQCRMIVLQPGIDNARKTEIYTRVKGDEKEFMKEARAQGNQMLAERSGDVPPIYRHFPDQNIEHEVFTLDGRVLLKVGEVSGIVGLPDKSFAILRCEKIIPPDGTKIYENERTALHKEVYEMKLQEEIPKMFEEMRKAANVRRLFGNQTDDLASQVQRSLQQTSSVDYTPRSAPPPLSGKN